MRHIKFRAWEKEMKEMILVEDISFELRQINTTSAWRYFEEVELLQYTGLKDNNGVEIYEGDIVRVRQPHTSVTCVNFGESVNEVSWINENLQVVKWRGCNNPGWDGVLIWGEGKLEVIGNIYENPELLEREGEWK